MLHPFKICLHSSRHVELL
jgi:hypothetical protein